MASSIVRNDTIISRAMRHWTLDLDDTEETWSGTWPPTEDIPNIAGPYRRVRVDIQIEAGSTAEVKLKPYSLGDSSDTGGEESDAWTEADMPADPADFEAVRKIGIAITNNDSDLRLIFTAFDPS